METRFLATLLTVVETSSLAETARRLNITPSAVVQRIRALEGEVGQALIQRSGHSMRPTAAASAILPELRRMLALEDDLKAAATSNLEVGLLRVGVIQTALTGLLPDILIALRRSRPKLEMYILPGSSAEMYAKVLDGRLDAAIVVEPPMALPKSVDWQLLRREALLLVTPGGVDGSDPKLILRGEPFIRYDRNHWGGRLVDLHLRKMRIRPNEHYELDSLEAITILVDRGLGVSLIPDWLPPWPEGVAVRRIKVTGAPTRNLGIVWMRSSNRLPLIRAFLSEALRACRPAEGTAAG